MRKSNAIYALYLFAAAFGSAIAGEYAMTRDLNIIGSLFMVYAFCAAFLALVVLSGPRR